MEIMRMNDHTAHVAVLPTSAAASLRSSALQYLESPVAVQCTSSAPLLLSMTSRK